MVRFFHICLPCRPPPPRTPTLKTSVLAWATSSSGMASAMATATMQGRIGMDDSKVSRRKAKGHQGLAGHVGHDKCNDFPQGKSQLLAAHARNVKTLQKSDIVRTEHAAMPIAQSCPIASSQFYLSTRVSPNPWLQFVSGCIVDRLSEQTHMNCCPT